MFDLHFCMKIYLYLNMITAVPISLFDPKLKQFSIELLFSYYGTQYQQMTLSDLHYRQVTNLYSFQIKNYLGISFRLKISLCFKPKHLKLLLIWIQANNYSIT